MAQKRDLEGLLRDRQNVAAAARTDADTLRAQLAEAGVSGTRG
jgi:hypothetical protein